MATLLRQPIDIPSLTTYLTQHIPNITTPLTITQFNSGHSNPTYLLTTPFNTKYVLRKKPPGHIVNTSAHQVEREARIITALEHTAVPVPKVCHLCTDASVIGTPFFVMQYIEGRTIKDESIPGVSPAHRRECWRDAIRVLVKLHQVDFRAVGLSDWQRKDAFYTRQLKTFGKIEEAQSSVMDIETGKRLGRIPHFDEMWDFFKARQPKDRVVLVHGDYKIDNLLFHPTEPRVVGVLDWEMATVGHPLSDFAYVTGPYEVVKGMGAKEGFDEEKGGREGLPTLKEVVQWYEEEAGWEVKGDLEWGRAFSFARGLVNIQGIAARYARRQASGIEAKEVAETLRPMAEKAWRIVQGLKGKEREGRGRL